jgi:hypothetical protein
MSPWRTRKPYPDPHWILPQNLRESIVLLTFQPPELREEISVVLTHLLCGGYYSIPMQ